MQKLINFLKNKLFIGTKYPPKEWLNANFARFKQEALTTKITMFEIYLRESKK